MEDIRKIEKIIQPFYEGLAQRKILGRKCKQCGAIEYPPRYACNTCGYHETEWVELSGKGKIHSMVLPSTLNADPWNSAIGSYGFGLVELEEGPMFNATIFGISRKIYKKYRDQLPLPVHALFVDKEDYTTVFYELDEEVINAKQNAKTSEIGIFE